MYVNRIVPDFRGGFYWVHRYQRPATRIIPVFEDKSSAWRPLRQRPRDGTITRHKTGGLRRVS